MAVGKGTRLTEIADVLDLAFIGLVELQAHCPPPYFCCLNAPLIFLGLQMEATLSWNQVEPAEIKTSSQLVGWVILTLISAGEEEQRIVERIPSQHLVPFDYIAFLEQLMFFLAPQHIS